jgi:hypothetical protein
VGRVRCRFASPPIFRHGGLQEIVDGHHTQDVVVCVDHRNGDQVVIGHQQGDIGHVSCRANPDRVHVCQVEVNNTQRKSARRAGLRSRRTGLTNWLTEGGLQCRIRANLQQGG